MYDNFSDYIFQKCAEKSTNALPDNAELLVHIPKLNNKFMDCTKDYY